MPSGLEQTLQGKVREKLRRLFWEFHSLRNENWKQMIKHIATTARDNLSWSYGWNPLFWAAALSAVLGAAASDILPNVAAPLERRAAAHAAAMTHMEEMLANCGADPGCKCAPVNTGSEPSQLSRSDAPAEGDVASRSGAFAAGTFAAKHSDWEAFLFGASAAGPVIRIWV